MRKILFYIIFFILAVSLDAGADTVYLKNGRHMEGVIKKETKKDFILDLGIGSVKFRKEDVERVEKSAPEEAESIREKWRDENKPVTPGRPMTKEIGFTHANNQMMASALLNKTLNTTLLIDTGSGLVVLSNATAEKLGIDTSKDPVEVVQVQVGDGHAFYARAITLDSIEVEGMEAENIDAAVFPKDAGIDIGDGILGMSFLRKFKFQIDFTNNKLILER